LTILNLSFEALAFDPYSFLLSTSKFIGLLSPC